MFPGECATCACELCASAFTSDRCDNDNISEGGSTLYADLSFEEDILACGAATRRPIRRFLLSSSSISTKGRKLPDLTNNLDNIWGEISCAKVAIWARQKEFVSDISTGHLLNWICAKPRPIRVAFAFLRRGKKTRADFSKDR